MESKKYTMDLAGRPLTLEFGKYCEQAAGSVWVHLGDTVVMVNATMSPTPRPGVDFFPLAVDVEEKQYSVGKIPGGFIKREGRPTEKATLTCRLIDRPLRPLFNKGMRNDVQVVVTILSVEQDVPPEIPAMIGSSIALAVSDIPWNGPTGAVVVGRVNGQYVINPDEEQRKQSDMHVYLAGTKDAIMMVEAGANEVSEDVMLDAIMFGHEEIKKLVAFQEEIVAAIGKPKAEVPLNVTGDDVKAAVREYAYDKCVWVFDTFDRQERQQREAQVKEETIAALSEQFPEREAEIADALAGWIAADEPYADNYALALALMGDERACPRLRQMIARPSQLGKIVPLPVRAACLLGRIGAAEDAEALLKLVEDDAKECAAAMPSCEKYPTEGARAYAMLSMAIMSLARIARRHPALYEGIAQRLQIWTRKPLTCTAGYQPHDCAPILRDAVRRLFPS